VIVRRDLALGVAAANIVHAAGESSPGNLPSSTYAVALACPDEVALRSLAARLTAVGVRHRAIVECEGEHAGQMMAIGCAPERKEVMRRHLSSLPLLR
jgi:hypothetical protein